MKGLTIFSFILSLAALIAIILYFTSPKRQDDAKSSTTSAVPAQPAMPKEKAEGDTIEIWFDIVNLRRSLGDSIVQKLEAVLAGKKIYVNAYRFAFPNMEAEMMPLKIDTCRSLTLEVNSRQEIGGGIITGKRYLVISGLYKYVWPEDGVRFSVQDVSCENSLGWFYAKDNFITEFAGPGKDVYLGGASIEEQYYFCGGGLVTVKKSRC